MSELIVQREEHVVYITINRPDKKNALTPELLIELADVLDSHAGEEKTLVPVISGAGEQFFSSGYDISRIPTLDDEDARAFAGHKPLDRAIEAIENFPFPVIAKLNGSVFGGACELIFACDLRIAAEGISMSLPPARLGLVYSLRGMERIAGIIGGSNLKRMIFTADRFNTDELRRFGAIDVLYKKEELDQEAEKLARQIGALAPLSHKGHKQICRILSKRLLRSEDEELALSIIEKSYLSDDSREGKQAFLEKRPANFLGR